MGLLDSIKSMLGEQTPTESRYECLACDHRFNSAAPIEKISCTRCGDRDIREVALN